MAIIYQRWLTLRSKLLWAYEKKASADHAEEMCAQVYSVENSAWLILDGTAEVRSSAGNLKVGAGQWLFPPHGKRQQIFLGPLHIRSITFQSLWPDGTHLFRLPKAFTREYGECPQFDRASREIVNKVRHLLGDDHWYLGHYKTSTDEWFKIQKLLALWLERYHQASSDKVIGPEGIPMLDERVRKVLKLLELYDCKEELSVEMLAASVFLSRRHLDRLVQASIGESTKVLINRKRLTLAKSLLDRSELQVSEVAQKMGFLDGSNFARWFASQAGMSPRTYRQAIGSRGLSRSKGIGSASKG